METRYMVRGPILNSLLTLAVPLFISNLMQQFYNIADTVIVGRFIGERALAAVGASFSLMNFIISIIVGLTLGSGAIFSMRYGSEDDRGLKESVHSSFVLIMVATLLLNLLVYVFVDDIIGWMNVPASVVWDMKSYLLVIFAGIGATSLYNYFASLYRSLGDSRTPMIFLAVSIIVNIVLDLVFVAVFEWGVAGAAWATITSQYMAGLGILVYAYWKMPQFRFKMSENLLSFASIKLISKYSFLTSVQQSIMNFGILMIQGLVNSFGLSVMAAFTAAVKIDAFAYLPVQDFGNAFSIFIAQNHGAGEKERIRKGIKIAFVFSAFFAISISLMIYVFAEPLIGIFIKENAEVVSIGAKYLRIEGLFYIGIAWLFLLYGFYRAIEKPGMSVVLTVCSLGTRVVLANYLSSIASIGLVGIWWSIVIGWFLADIVGIGYYFIKKTGI